jgi:hypothetical protein
MGGLAKPGDLIVRLMSDADSDSLVLGFTGKRWLNVRLGARGVLTVSSLLRQVQQFWREHETWIIT